MQLKQFGVIFGLLSLAAIAVSAFGGPGFAPNDACVGNQRQLVRAILSYEQDYDDTMPNMTNPAFERQVGLYLPAKRMFVCPDTGVTYLPNEKLSGKSVSQNQDQYATEVLQDEKPHADGLKTIAYLDGHITRGGVIQGDPKVSCVDQASQINLALIEYAQDYDQTLPDMRTPAGFEKALLPYSLGAGDFSCPVTGAKYAPDPAISFKHLNEFNPGTTGTFQDSVPHPDGFKTYAFLDGHVENAGVTTVRNTDLTNLKMLGLSVAMYEQDYDERFPPLNNYANFVNLIYPYAVTKSIFHSPDTGLPYVLNQSLSGVSTESIPDLSSAGVAWDSEFNNDGSLNTLYADGQVGSTYSFVAVGLSSDMQGRPTLIENALGREFPPAVEMPSTLSDVGLPLSSFDYLTSSQPDGSLPELNVPGATYGPLTTLTGNRRLIAIVGRTDQFGPFVPGQPLGMSTVMRTGSAGQITSFVRLGPYDGWTFDKLASSGEYKVRALWTRYDGTMAIWTVKPDGSYGGDVQLTPDEGEFPMDLAVASDGSSRLLLSNVNGDAFVWSVAANGIVTNKLAFPGGADQRVVGIALGPTDGLLRLLWTDNGGDAEIATVGHSGHVKSTLLTALTPDWTPTQFILDDSQSAILLWKKPGAESVLEKIKLSGKVVYTRRYGP